MSEGIDHAGLATLARDYAPRDVHPLAPWRQGGALLKAYTITPAGHEVDEALLQRARELSAVQSRLDRDAGGLGLGVVIVHRGADGDYVILLHWIEDFMSRTTIFAGARGEPDQLRPASAGLSPCLWELAVLAHERTAFHRLLQGDDQEAALAAWQADTFTGAV